MMTFVNALSAEYLFGGAEGFANSFMSAEKGKSATWELKLSDGFLHKVFRERLRLSSFEGMKERLATIAFSLGGRTFCVQDVPVLTHVSFHVYPWVGERYVFEMY